MKNRRMFSADVVTSDAFLDMPSGCQLLYFQLGMQADDDGFVSSPKKVMRFIGSNDDDIKILISKKFIIPFTSGICVVKHWRINNQLRKDRYNETKYTDEKKQLFIRPNGAYTLNKNGSIELPNGHFNIEDLSFGNHLATNGIPSIGKVSIGKVSKDIGDDVEIERSIYPSDFEAFYKEYPLKKGKGAALRAWKKLKPTEKTLTIASILTQVKSNHFKGHNGQDFIPHPATWLNQRRWEDEIKSPITKETIVIK